jgi:hypothetical protein
VGDFLLAYVEASGFDQPSELLFGNASIFIEVTADECFIEVEARSLVESLSE